MALSVFAAACSAPILLDSGAALPTTSRLVNMNPDPFGEPWMAGGMPVPDAASRAVIDAAAVYTPAVVKPTLPGRVDNSSNKYFRPVFNQADGSCAQASGVAYTYTYEINRLRDLDSSLAANQYPTHFTYNYLNGGNGNNGSWYWDGWKIIGDMGVPNVNDYGGLYINSTVWKSGYQLYRNAMNNSIAGYSRIDVSTPAGLDTLKQWLAHHGDGSSFGGLAVFAAGAVSTAPNTVETRQIPAGLPEAGKWIITKWGTTMNHAMTFVGYDDSVKIDYNGDGLYTNDKDIDGDGAVTLKDYEVGALIVVNSWGTSWGDNGRSYMMYRLLGEYQGYTGNGGVYNNEVWIIHTPNASYSPKATLKVAFNHNKRARISLVAGLSTDLNATVAQYNQTFKAMDLRGGDWPVNGAGTTGDIEVGLDLTGLINKLPVGTTTYKLFFMIYESDSDNTGSGSLTSLQLIDHTANNQVYSSTASNVALLNNNNTVFTILKNNTISSVYPSMFLRGTMNGWGTTAMTLASNNLWQVSVNLPASTAYWYKYDAYGNWAGATNWGTSATAGIGGAGGGNISYTTGVAGAYTFQFNDSTKAYTVIAPSGGVVTASAPAFDVASGAVSPGTVVTMKSSTANSTVYYTTDGSTPTTSSAVGPAGAAYAKVTISSAVTIKTMAVASGMTNSPVATATYTLLSSATPTFSKASGNLTAGTVVTLSSTTAGSTIYYTVDGSIPTTASLSGPAGAASASVTVNSGLTIKAFAWKSGFVDSAVASATYTVTTNTSGNLTITFITGGNNENVTFPGDANGWSLSANSLSAPKGTSTTLTLNGVVTATTLAQGNNTGLLELKLCNISAGWNGAWGFASWTKGAGISMTDGAGQQIGISCQPGQNVNLTINVATTSLSVTYQ